MDSFNTIDKFNKLQKEHENNMLFNSFEDITIIDNNDFIDNIQKYIDMIDNIKNYINKLKINILTNEKIINKYELFNNNLTNLNNEYKNIIKLIDNPEISYNNINIDNNFFLDYRHVYKDYI